MTEKVILFDINETVLDLRALDDRFEAVFGDRDVNPLWFAALLHMSCVATVTGVKTRFADLAGIALETLAARRGTLINTSDKTNILEGFADLAPHKDVTEALSLLRAKGYRTIAFTNSSEVLVKNQISNAGLAPLFDRIISVEKTGQFKPSAAVYHYAASEINQPIGDLRLIATHDWDTHGALSAGMKAAYIDRSGAVYNPLYLKPDIFAANMVDLAGAIIAADNLAP